MGDTPLSGALAGRAAFREWLGGVLTRFPDVRFEVRDVAVAGWPWRTRVAVPLGISATLPEGTPYENQAAQWVTLRWGRMVDDWVLEDSEALNRACRATEVVGSASTTGPGR